MHIPRQDPGQEQNRTLQVMGIIGILLGVYMIFMTATGQGWQRLPALGYVVGTGLVFFGLWRFTRGSRGGRR